MKREEIIDVIERKLPQMVKMVKHAQKENIEEIVMHQDAFAADFQEAEIILLGCAIKYVGFFNKNIHIVG